MCIRDRRWPILKAARVAGGTMNNSRLNWKIGGEAGYGILTVGEIFSKTFVKGGYHVVAHPEYPSLIRGGHNTFQLRIDAQRVRAPILSLIHISEPTRPY